MNKELEKQKELLNLITQGRAYNVNLLIQEGADINAEDEYGDTPLHHAVTLGKTRIAKILIENGADLNARNNNLFPQQ
ncbi:MAG: hypothetical protein CVU88_03045 [Firmicutes bacterium HGW-Firmicutes-13]|nr:MAG: hypothetical protein CVU88_03045 [Firmicutes bacterium HGW-Firmicutes-13]